MFKTEKDLVNCFIDQLLPWGGWKHEGKNVQVSSEFNYIRGRTDIVAVTLNDEVVAFEAKLTKWREALHQAYRNTCFSDRSYIVLPFEVALRAAEFKHDFDLRGVGLCGVAHGKVHILRWAPRCTPTEPWLTRRAMKHIQSTGAHVAA